MAIDFPASPSNGQLFVSGSTVWTWVAAKSRWEESTLQTALPRNRFINPGFVASQENGNTGSSTNGFFMADGWSHSASSTIAPAVETGMRAVATTLRGGNWRLRIGVTTPKAALAAGDYLGFVGFVEGFKIADLAYATAYAKQAIIRFGVNFPAGTYHVCVRSASRAYPAPFTVTADRANLDTEYTVFISPDAGGTWAFDATMLQVWFTLAAGTTYNTGTANAWSTTGMPVASPSQSNGVAVNNTFTLFDPGFYVDPLYTGIAPPWESSDELSSLMEAQRYWYKCMFSLGTATTATTAARVGAKHPQMMRATPTYGLVGSPTAYDGTSNLPVTAFSAGYGNTYEMELNATSSGLTAYRGAAIIGTGTAYVAVNAR